MSKQKDHYLSEEAKEQKLREQERTESWAQLQAGATIERLEKEVLDCECNSWIHPHPDCWDKATLAAEIKKFYGWN